jgi:PPOX class probable F420-dependent enzyme
MALSEAARAYLSERRFAVLATISKDGMPHQTTMWYELRGDTIIMNTRVGRLKDQHLRRDPRASICVEDDYRYVTISGTVELIEDQATAQEDIRRLAIRYDGQESGERQAREMFSKQQRVTIHLPITHVIEHGFDEEA